MGKSVDDCIMARAIAEAGARLRVAACEFAGLPVEVEDSDPEDSAGKRAWRRLQRAARDYVALARPSDY